MHIDSHYSSNISNIPEYNPLDTDITTNTCVVGAGLCGLTTARELARNGHDVVVLDAEKVGWGASGRNGGFVSAGFARSLDSIAQKIGWEDTKELYQLSVDGRNYVENAIQQLEMHQVKLGDGWLKLLRHRNIDEFHRLKDVMHQQFGIEWDLIPGNELNDLICSDAYFAGLHDKFPFHIQPLAYAIGLAQDVERHSGRIFEHTRCNNIQCQGTDHNSRWRLSTSQGDVFADNIVLATSAYGGPDRKLNSAMVPVATYVVSSAPAPELLNKYISFKGAISDTRRSGDYYRTIGSGKNRRLIWGGRITTLVSQPNRLAAMLKNDIHHVYPALHELKIERAWSGLMGYSRHQMPIITQLRPSLWAASAFGGHGLNTTAMAGQLVSGAILNNDDRYKLFDKFGATWSGGLFGKIATQLEYWRLQYLDRRDEK